MSHPWVQLLVRWSILALGVTLASHLVPGIRYDSPTTLLVAVLLLSLFNAVLRPVLVLFTLPFIVLTMGLGMLVVNAFTFWAAAWVSSNWFNAGFYVDSFWAALFGSIVVSIVSFIISLFLADAKPNRG